VEDADAVVGAGVVGCSRNVVSLRLVQLAKACICASSSASAPCTTASGLPFSGVA
jgi:hypothetical protein